MKNNYSKRNFKKQRTDDKLTVNERSVLMSKIKSKNTKFETDFISILKKKIRKKFNTNVATIKGKPDIVFEKQKLCVFLDSNFWHGWQYPRWKQQLKNDFWRNKIENNRKRDKRNIIFLKRNGWNVIRIWEHQIKTTPDKQIARIQKFFSQ